MSHDCQHVAFVDNPADCVAYLRRQGFDPRDDQCCECYFTDDTDWGEDDE